MMSETPVSDKLPWEPVSQADIKVRSKEPLLLLDKALVGSVTSYNSDGVHVSPYRHFVVYLRILSGGTGAQVLQVIPQFLEPESGKWHDYLEGVWASAFWEDVDTATEKDVVLHGDCVGREFRLRLVGTSTSSSLTFTVSAAVEFYE